MEQRTLPAQAGAHNQFMLSAEQFNRSGHLQVCAMLPAKPIVIAGIGKHAQTRFSVRKARHKL